MNFTITITGSISDDNTDPIADLAALIGTLAPYMVDNVEIDTKLK